MPQRRIGDGAILYETGYGSLTKGLAQRRQRQWRHDLEYAIGRKDAVGREQVNMRVEINQVAEGLYEKD